MTDFKITNRPPKDKFIFFHPNNLFFILINNIIIRKKNKNKHDAQINKGIIYNKGHNIK